MSESKNKHSKKEDFIDLDNSQYKKKTNYIRNVSIFLISCILFFSTGVYFENILDFLKSSNEYEIFEGSDNTNAPLITSEKIFVEEELKNYEDKKNLNFESSSVISEKERINNHKFEENIKILENLVENSNSRSLNNFEKIKENDLSLKNLIRRVEELSAANFEGNFDERFYDGNKILVNFAVLKEKYTSRKNFGNELNRLLDFYKNNKKLKGLLEFFTRLEINSLKTKIYLLTELNNNLKFYNESFDQFILRIEKDEEFEGKKIFGSKENFINYLRNIFNSTFKITRLENPKIKGGSEYKYNETLKESLLLAKEFLIFGELKKSIETIKNSNFAMDNFKYWLDEAYAILEADEKMHELESELLTVIGSNFD